MGLLRKLSSYFLSPPFTHDEEGKKITASYLKVILLIAFAVLLVYVGFKILEAGSLFPADFILLGWYFFYLSLLYCIKRESSSDGS
jgi:hypothetical protein